MIGNKIANKITKFSKTSQQNNLGTVTNEYDKEMPKKKKIYIYIYIYPEEIQKITDSLRLI